MKTFTILASNGWALGICRQGVVPRLTPVVAAALLVGSGAFSVPSAAQANSPGDGNLLAQMPMPPLPVSDTYANAPQMAAGGQQYLVYVNGASDLLLNQVRLVEPQAFRTFHEGQSVIQVGRFNQYQNAQMQVSSLTNQGISAAIAQVDAATAMGTTAFIPPSTPSGGAVSPPTTYSAEGSLPPLPVVAVPQGSTPAVPAAANGSVEFGQPPANLNGAYTPPPPAQMAAPTVAATPVATVVPAAPYYVVIPGRLEDLPSISSRVIQLGAPPDRVQQRQSPHGPHVAIGPFQDRGLAQQWNGYFRGEGFNASRVFFDR